MNKIAIVTTVYNRMRVTRPVLRHYAKMSPEGIDVQLHAVCSSEEDAIACRKEGWTVHYHPNSPLNEKHNHGVRAVRDWDIDAVCIVNSDDIFTRSYLEAAKEMVDERGARVVRFMSYVFVNTETGEAAHQLQAFPASGMVIHRDVLDELDWEPWRGDSIDKWLDNRLGKNLEEIEPHACGFSVQPEDAVQLCALKSGTNIWSYEEHLLACPGSRTPVDVTEYMERHFPSVLDDILLPDAAIQREE